MPRSVRLDTKQLAADRQVTVGFDEAIECIKKKAQKPDSRFTFNNVNDPNFEFIISNIFGSRYILVTDVPENVNNVLEEFMLAWNYQVARQATKHVGQLQAKKSLLSGAQKAINSLISKAGSLEGNEECQKCEAANCINRKAPNISGQLSKRLIAELKDLLEALFEITEDRGQTFSIGTLSRLSSLNVRIEIKVKAISEAMEAEGAVPFMIFKCIETALNEAYDHFKKESQGKQENKEPEVDSARANYNPVKGEAELIVLLSQAKLLRQHMTTGMGVADLTFRSEGELLFYWNDLGSDGRFFLEDNRAYWENAFKRVNLRIVSMPGAQEQSSN
jgi:hypothetical protein